jgi:hypothetical protein
MLGDKIGQGSLVKDRDIVGSMHRRKSVPKLTFEDRRDRAATILEDMVVNDQETRWRDR